MTFFLEKVGLVLTFSVTEVFSISFQKLEYRTEHVSVKNINTKIGLELKGNEMAKLLSRMSLSTKVLDEDTLEVKFFCKL